MAVFQSFTGRIIKIEDFNNSLDMNSGCTKRITLQDQSGSVVNFIVTPSTYFVDHVMVSEGDVATGFYDTRVPIILIYPPQYRAVVMTRFTARQNVKVDFFDDQLLSSDGMLRLNLTPSTPILLENNQMFTQNPGNHNLIVIYGPTTRSIPAQTMPYKIIVLCREETRP